MILPNMEIPKTQPCESCGGTEQTIVASRPPGRMNDVFRVECACGKAPGMWSVSESAAVRLWNQHMAEEKKP